MMSIWRLKKKSNLGYNYNSECALQRYGLWMQNAIKELNVQWRSVKRFEL